MYNKKEVERFLQRGKTNREYEAYLAYRYKSNWPYSIPLDNVVFYFKTVKV